MKLNEIKEPDVSVSLKALVLREGVRELKNKGNCDDKMVY